MTEKELRQLSRKELLELLVNQAQRQKELKNELSRAEAALADRQLKIARAGTLAEAALQLNGVFEAADAAVQQYRQNLMTLDQRQADAEAQCAAMLEQTRQQCEALRAEAQQQADAYWQRTARRLQALYDAFPGLKERLESPQG